MHAARAMIVPASVPAPRAVTRTAPVALVPTRKERPLAPPEVRTRLLRCLDAAAAQPTMETMAALRAALTDVVDRLKAQGLSLERLVAVVEAVTQEHATARPLLRLHADTLQTRDVAGLHARVLAWCARAYRDDAWW